MQTVTCSYHDTPSRVGGRMNASAFEALRHDTADILNGFAWLGQHGEEGAPRRLFVTSYLGVTLALALFHRAQDPVASYGQLPSYVASIFKASRGIFSFSVDLLNRLIERTLAAILTGEGADAGRSHIGELVDFAVLWELYELQDRFGQALSSYRAVLEGVTATGGPAADPSRLFSVVLPDGTSVGQRTEALLALAADVQRGMNRILGRAENAKPLGFDDVLRLL
jgi:hypothetical protein